MTSVGFPHSDISGSTPACDSPELFAANHVLHRLLTPRHPSCALSSLTTNLLWLASRSRRTKARVVPRKLVDGIKPPKFRDTPSTRSRSKLHEGAQTRRIPSTLVLSQRHAFAPSSVIRFSKIREVAVDSRRKTANLSSSFSFVKSLGRWS